jgi:ArsR family transcriptional regulator
MSKAYGIFALTNMSTPCCSAKPTPKVKDLEALTSVYAALADSTRLRILSLLGDGEICVCHIHASLDVPQPTASRHLAYLRKSGLVEARREGIWMHYRLAPQDNPVVAAVVKSALHALTHTDIRAKDERRLQVALKAS